MKIFEKYTGEKVYMFPNGSLATKEAMLSHFPAVLSFVHVIETDDAGEVAFAVQNLGTLRSLYNIDKSLSEEEAIAAIQEAANYVPEDIGVSNEELTATSLASIAASLEYQNMSTLDDVE